MEENSSHGKTAPVSPSKLVVPVSSPESSLAPPKDVAAPKASLASAVAAAFPEPAESAQAVADNPALTPLQAMQRQFSLLNMDGKLWLVDRFSIDRLTAQGIVAKLSLSNREDGALLIRRALKAQFPKIDTRSVLSEFWDSPETICNSGIEFNPAGTSEHYLNLWVGPTIVAKQGSWTLIAAFFLDVVCAGDADNRPHNQANCVRGIAQMTMIKCSECGKDISDKASVCISCGAPISSGPDAVTARTPPPAFENLGDMNGDGKVDFEDFKAVYKKIKESSPEAQSAEDSKVAAGTSPETQ